MNLHTSATLAVSLLFDDSNSDSLLGSKRRICSISTTNAVYSSLVTSSCDDCSASFLSAGDCALVVSRPPPSTYRLLDVAVLHLVLDFCGFLLFDVRLDIHLGLVFQGLFTKFLLFICCAGTRKCCLLLGRCRREVMLPQSCSSSTGGDFAALARLGVQRHDTLLDDFCSTLHGVSSSLHVPCRPKIFLN